MTLMKFKRTTQADGTIKFERIPMEEYLDQLDEEELYELKIRQIMMRKEKENEA